MDVKHSQNTEGMVTKGLLVRFEAKPGREAEVTALLESGLAAVLSEPDTIAWLAIRLGPASSAVVDAFPHEAGRQAHLEAGQMRLNDAAAADLFAAPPSFTYTEIVAAKLPPV